jgi:glutathione S-transferase
MRLKLYVVNGSHPCAAVRKALELKGLDYTVVEWPPPMHAPMQRLLFGARTVPSLRIDGAEKISGSRRIMRRLEELAPEPPLFPADPDKRAAVEEAETWGDEVFQPVGRTLIWAAFHHSPAAMLSYTDGSKLPLPKFAIKASAPLITAASMRLNRTGDGPARRDLELLAGYLDRVDGYFNAGTLGDAEHVNAAALQICSTIRLLMTLADVRPMIDGRPCAGLTLSLFPWAPGQMPAGSLPAVRARREQVHDVH